MNPTGQIMVMSDYGQVQQFIERTTGLDANHIGYYTTLILGLISDGVWNKLDLLHIYATADASDALVNLCSPNYKGVNAGNLTFTTDRGYTGVDAGSNVINAGYDPSSGNTLFTQNSAHLSVWNLTAGNDNRPCVGASSGSWNADIFPQFGDGKTYFFANDAGMSITNSTQTGHFVANRDSSSSAQGYQNGSSLITSSSLTSVAPLGQISICGQHSGASFLGAGNQVAAVSMGQSLSSTDVSNLYSRLRTYMTSVGVP